MPQPARALTPPVPAGALGASFAPSTFLAEGLGAYQLRLHYESSAILFLVIGLVLLVIAMRRSRPAPLLACTAMVCRPPLPASAIS